MLLYTPCTGCLSFPRCCVVMGEAVSFIRSCDASVFTYLRFFLFCFFLSSGIHTKMIGLRLPKTPLSLPFPKTSVKAHFRPFQSTRQKSVRSLSKQDALGFLRENYEKWIKCPQKLLFVKPTNKKYIYIIRLKLLSVNSFSTENLISNRT